ncbi:Piso0_000661 [Millerozyma farinosa CBS 7064]|uniref:low-specificity L-threonine aldolase n=1 Tax=Pichia sorbitophila (strain ATCC MYA-4447 / BCRC 22081 / CBS 7064 / NBRC 10061 / NRRL Y-12695) TaxID=559304 RepID=G8YR61_PICSO|nr:Piso0_000661 [Millerozyma farinosa CBS 7064]
MTVHNEKFSTHNEFRSDTFTVPTKSMLNTLSECSFGDAVYNEDENTLRLESKMEEITGKEAALFCVSGTMSNQIGLRAILQQPPYSILCDYRAHVFLHEAGGLATLSQAMVHPVRPANGDYLTLEDIAENFTEDDGDIHAAPTKVISLENTLHGIIMPIEEIKRISEFAREHGILMHLDGARLWNASVETGVSIKEYCQYFDTVSLCLSKSLGAPVGSILVGEKSVIRKANHFKKQAGGGIRQGGMLSLMAIHAIDENFEKLHYAHELAKEIGNFCNQHSIYLESPVNTNFVFIDIKKNRMNDAVLVQIGEKHALKLMGGRLAFHFQLSRESVESLKQVLLECKAYAIEHPFTKTVSNKKFYNYEALSKALPH